MFKRQDVPMKNTGTDTVQSQDINNSSSSTSSSSSDSLRRSQMVLATDITQGLISEVRKLQSSLLEKDQIIKELEISQADINKENILIQKHLKQKDEIEEKLKEENWNLEVTNQELQERLTDLNQTISKLNVEHTKVLKQLRNSTEQIEIFKAQDEKTKSTMEAMKARYDHEQQVLRRNNGNLHREMEQLKKTMNDLNTEFKIQRAKLAIKSTVDNNANQQHQSINNNTLLELSKDDTTFDSTKEATDQQGVNELINSSSSSKSQHWALEVDTLKQSLSHAHRTISILRSNLHKEKLEKMEFKKMLADTQEQVEQLQKDIEQRNSNNRSSKKKSSSKSNTTTATAATTSSRKRVGLRKKSSKISLLKSPNSENNNQRLDENYIEEEEECQIENRDEPAASDSNNSSDEDDMSSQDGSMDDNYLGGGNPLSLELSGQSLGIELQMGGFMGSSFKPLSSELNDSMAKPQTFDKGINTENDWVMADNKSQIINSKISDQDQKQQLHTEILPEIQHKIGSLANLSTPSSTTIITQNVDTVNAGQTIKNSNNIHAETSTMLNHDTPSHVSPITKISVDQQRGKISNMGQYHTSVHSQAPFTIQHNDDDSSDVDKKMAHDGTMDSPTKAFNETTILVANATEQQVQMAGSEITSSENTSTISDSEIKTIKSKEQPPSPSLSTATATALPLSPESTDTINNNNNIVYKELTEEYHNHIRENSGRHIVGDEQMNNKDIAVVKPLADEIVIATTITKEPSSHLTNKLGQVECSTINVHGEKRAVDQQTYKVKENEQNTIETIQDTQKMVEQINEEKNEPHHQQVQDNGNYQELNQQLETNKFKNTTIQQQEENVTQQVDMNQKDNQEITQQVMAQNENNQRKVIEQEVIQQADMGQKENQEVTKQAIQKEIIERKAIQQTNLKQKDGQEDIVQHGYTQQENNQQKDNLKTIKQVTIQQEGVKQDSYQKYIKQEIIQNEDSQSIVTEQENIGQKITKLVEEPQAIHATNQHDKVIETEQTSIQQMEGYENYKENNDKNNSNDSYVDGTTMEEEFDLDSMSTTHDMISRDEANALIKMAIADALAKERLEAANKRRQSEADFISRSEAEMLTKQRVDEALKKERERLSKVVQKRHSIISLKQLKDKESDNKNKVNDSMNEAPETKNQTKRQSSPQSQIQPQPQPQSPSPRTSASISSQDNQAIVQTSKLAQRALQHRTSTKNLSAIPQPSISSSSTHTQTSTSPPSRLGLFSGFSKLQPSLSTPSKGSRNIRPSVSSSSLRRASRPKNATTTSSSTNATEMDTDSRKSYMASTSPLKKTNSVDAAQHLSPSSAAESFGNVRITEKSTYTYKRPMTASNQDTLSKQPSIQSFVSIASSMHDRSGNTFPYSTDEKLQLSNDLVSAITQTMIGEWMWKFTRRHVGNGISENKHKRFFWLHPFARTLYWNTVEPGAESKEVKAKSAFIESVSSIPNHENSNECPFSLLIKTSKRDLKITAPNLERHEIWKLALSFLIIPENYEDTVGNVVNNSVSLSTSKMPPSTVTLLTSASNTTHEEMDEIINNEKETANSEEVAYDSDDSLNVHITDHSDTPKSPT